MHYYIFKSFQRNIINIIAETLDVCRTIKWYYLGMETPKNKSEKCLLKKTKLIVEGKN